MADINQTTQKQRCIV